jgi:hypothetical protein
VKIHLKRSATDHLTLCKKWLADNWVLEEVAQQAASTICKICDIVAAKLILPKTDPVVSKK